jgi:hypothetical protein
MFGKVAGELKGNFSSRILSLLGWCLFTTIFCCGGNQPGHTTKEDNPEYVGEMIEKTRLVFEGTGTQSDFEQVIEFGRDTRYYPVLRGWLVQEIANTKSQLTSQQKNSADEARLKEKLVRLERMLRLIDLE